MVKYVLFDLDGTLTDPSLGITNSIIYALEKMGLEIPPREELYRFIGPPLIPAFQSFLGMTEKEARNALSLYREYFAEIGLFENKPYQKIAEALSKIKKSGKHLAVATSKPEEFAARILEHFELDGYFDMICGATMDESRTEKTDVIKYTLEALRTSPDECIMVGDRKHDIKGAEANNMRSVGVLWGFGSREELENAGANFIVSNPEDLANIITDNIYSI